MERSLHMYKYILEIRLGFIGKVKKIIFVFLKFIKQERYRIIWYNYFCN